MKRLFILSAAVAALASCSNSEVITEVNEPQVPDKAIAFETFSSNATRAENSNASQVEGLNLHHGDFSVWGYKNVQDTYVFGTEGTTSPDQSTEGVKVSYNEASSKWTYSPIRFWDKGANSYEFYACAPATETTTDPHFVLNKKTGGTQADDYFTLNAVTLRNYTLSGTQYAQSMKENQVQNPEDGGTQITTGGNIDYMIADACKITTFTSSVQLHFNHILSRLNITVKKGETLNNAIAKLDVVSLEVKNMVSTGNFNESKKSGDELSEGTTGRWTVTTDGPKVTYVANALSDVKRDYLTDRDNYILQSLVIPQTIEYEEIKLDGSTNSPSQPYMKIVYVITTGTGNDTNTETYTAYYNLAAAFGAVKSSQVTAGGNEYSEVAFNEGWQNTLNITIDADAITFEPKVYQWGDKPYDFEIGEVLPNT